MPEPSSHREESHPGGHGGNTRGDSKADSLQVCFSTTSHPSSPHLQQHRGFPHPVPGAAVRARSRSLIRIKSCSVQLTRGSAQSPPAHGRKVTSHRVQKWQKPPVRSFIFPGQYPMAKLKINISLASSTTQPTLDNSCRGLASCWRYNPSMERAVFSGRHPGRYRKGGKKGKNMSLAQIFLIPGYHLHDQKQMRLTPL